MDVDAAGTETGTVEALRRLAAGHSLEITSAEWARQGAGLLAPVRPGTRVYLTYLPGSEFQATVDAAAGVAAAGSRAVPHLAARNFAGYDALADAVDRLTAVGVREVLVIGGSLAHPAGEITESMQVLRSGVLERYGIERVGVAGHPEGSRDIDDATLEKSLAEKNEFAATAPFAVHLVTQFAFAAEPIVSWERRIAAAGNELPVSVGLPGLATPARLVKFGLACGIGPSLTMLRKQTGSVVKLATGGPHHPDETMLELARHVAATPATRIAGLHFFPFGSVGPTTRWLQQVAAGRLRLTHAGRRFETVDDADRGAP